MAVAFVNDWSVGGGAWADMKGTSIDVLWILMGFLISATALVATSNNESIERAKGYDINVKSWGKKKYLYDELVAEIVWCTTCCALSIMGIVAASMAGMSDVWLFYIAMFSMSYCVFASMEMVLDMYQIFSSNRGQ